MTLIYVAFEAIIAEFMTVVKLRYCVWGLNIYGQYFHILYLYFYITLTLGAKWNHGVAAKWTTFCLSNWLRSCQLLFLPTNYESFSYKLTKLRKVLETAQRYALTCFIFKNQSPIKSCWLLLEQHWKQRCSFWSPNQPTPSVSPWLTIFVLQKKRWPTALQLSPRHDGDAIAQQISFVHEMRGEQNGATTFLPL